MISYVGNVNDAMGSASFFRQGGVGFLRDAWLAAEFGRHRQSSYVRLVPEREQWPDFEARWGDNIIERVECAEADISSRRRGNEYRNEGECAASSEPRFAPDPDYLFDARQLSAILSPVIALKIQKHYSNRISLLIYLNISKRDSLQAEIEAALTSNVAPALTHFKCVWILWQSQLHGPWSIGVDAPVSCVHFSSR